EYPPTVATDAGDGGDSGDSGADGGPDAGTNWTSGYQGLTNHPCTNPLYAASLPDGTDTSPATLCNLPVGTRPPERVFFMHIGGVPHQLLQVDPSNPDSATKDRLVDADWVKILGQDPQKYDYTGIDPHMIESYTPRPGLSTTPGSDPISDHEWTTDTAYAHGATSLGVDVDLEYACVFKLDAPRDCSLTDDVTQDVCDCTGKGLTAAEVPAVCDPAAPAHQIYAKAYPTTRELLLAKLVGDQG